MLWCRRHSLSTRPGRPANFEAPHLLSILGIVRSSPRGSAFSPFKRGSVLIVMLGGGDKSSQSADIAKAVKLAATIEE